MRRSIMAGMAPLSDLVLGHLGEILAEPPGAAGAADFAVADEPTQGSEGPLLSVADRFEILGTLGRGGMGDVYRARDSKLAREVALKVQHVGDPWRDQRFEREANALAQIRHPCVVSYLDHGCSQEGVLWLATEALAGETLAELLGRGVLAVASGLSIAGDVVAGLGAIHAHGLVHRDVKPANIFTMQGGHAKLLDLGLVGADKGGLAAGRASLTEAGALLGSIGYLSPEQARGERTIDARADLFALGCVLFECFTGAPPFGRTLAEAAAAFAMSAPPPLDRLPSSASLQLRALLHDLLEIDVRRRPQTAEVVGARLAAVMAGGPPGESLADDESPTLDRRKGGTLPQHRLREAAPALPFTRARSPAPTLQLPVVSDLRGRRPAPVEPSGPAIEHPQVGAVPLSTVPGRLASTAVSSETRPARLDLIWYDASKLSSVRGPDLSHNGAGEERNRVALSLATGTAVDPVELLERSAMVGGESPTPIVMVAGTIELLFDSRARLRAMLAAVRPLLVGRADLRRHWQACDDALRAVDEPPMSVADGFLARLSTQLATVGRTTKEAAEALTDRALVESRAFARRRLFATFPIRASLNLEPGEHAVPTYLSEAAAAALPLMRTFRARALVEPHPAHDDTGSGPLVLRVVALGRIVERLR